ncbi:MAG: hypothetical protein NTX42_11275 [Methanothrix sp.]|nr:hypothetical protein [Methanothrix sp.]
MAAELGLSERMARNLLKSWVEDGWLEKGKSVTTRPKLQFNGKISAIHQQLIGNALGRREEHGLIE